jgi:hypothetical protein
MTVIVGLEQDGNVWLGGDSIAINEYQICTVAEPKVFQKDRILFGFCGSFRIGQLVYRHLQIPQHPEDKSDIEYLVVNLVDSIRKLLVNKNIPEEEQKVTQFLVGYRRCLYYIDSDFYVGRVIDGYYAIGAGIDIALGSFFSTTSLDPISRINLALAASEKWSAAVRQPFTIISFDH